MFAEFDKVIKCLALELPESVWDDVDKKYRSLKADVEKFTSTNTGWPKCEQCIYWNVTHGHHETECYGCKRYHVDMFTPRDSD